jgi:hypothetical protein
MNDRDPKKPAAAPNVFANALASRHDYGGRAVEAGVHNTLECRHCGAARERDAEGPLVCRYCKGPLTHRGPR